MNYIYEAYTREGTAQKGELEAGSEREAEQKLRQRGLIVTKLAERDASSPKMKAAAHKAKNGKLKVPVKAMSEFAREFSVLVSTGTPIVDSIESLERQSRGTPLSSALAKLRERLEEGESLEDAMRSQEDVFGQVFCALVAAGEAGGNLDTMLRRVASLLRQEAKIRSNLMGAMMYPILLTGISLVVLGLMIGVVLPRFSSLFETLDSELPMSTMVLMTLAGFLRGYWFLVLPGVAGVFGALIYWVRSERGTRVFQSLMIKAPVLGALVRSLETARIFRVLGLLVESKVPIIDALSLTQRSVTVSAYKDLLTKAQDSVSIGEPVSMALGRGDLIVASAVEAVRNAEASGCMGGAMIQLADYLDEENETVVKSISTIIEPLIMIVLGVMVGLVAISMFLPLFDLTASAGSR